jgi:hypothetical protein
VTMNRTLIPVMEDPQPQAAHLGGFWDLSSSRGSARCNDHLASRQEGAAEIPGLNDKEHERSHDFSSLYATNYVFVSENIN